MRYLKKYTLFENNDYKNILEDINDILLPIKDLGYNNIKVKLIKDYNYIIFINIVDYDNEPLVFNEDIEYEFDRLFDYLEQNNLKLNKVYYKKVESDGRIFNKGTRDELNFSNPLSRYSFFSDVNNMSYFDINYLKKEIMNKKIAYLSFEVEDLKNK